MPTFLTSLVACMLTALVLTGTASADTRSFKNESAIAVPGSGEIGPASPYPSGVTVEGMTGPITDVNVTLHRFGHTNPADVRIVLVSPTGQKVRLMSSVCGTTDVEDYTWIFDDGAAAEMPVAADCEGFAYRPSGGVPANMPAPAPAGPYAPRLSAFNGKDANGTWLLYAVDVFDNDKGDIEMGWTLTVNTGPVDAAIPGSGGAGAASPYPLSVTLPTQQRVITDLGVHIDGIWHQRPDDLDLLLVGPRGQRTVLMSDACGSFGVAAFGWRWDDEAAAPMPDGDSTNLCGTTSHRPTDYEPGDVWPAPAPAGPYADTLSVFDGSDPSGEWRLYVNDDSFGAGGFFTNRFQVVAETRAKADVAFAEARVAIAEGETRDLTIRRSGAASPGAATVEVTSVPATATSGSDFEPVLKMVHFAPGDTAKTVPVTVLPDGDKEPEEAFVVTLGAASGDARIAPGASTTVTIPSQQNPAAAPGGGAAPAAGGQIGKPAPRCAGKKATIVGTSRRDVLRGTRRADVIVSLGGNDLVKAARGNDAVCAGSGKDVVLGQAGNDRLIGGAGSDRLVGGPGRDACPALSRRDRASCER